MKKLLTLLLAIILATPVVAHALGPPGNSGQVVLGPAQAGFYADIGSYNAYVLNPNAFEAIYTSTLSNTERHVFRDSASNPAAERAAPSMNTENIFTGGKVGGLQLTASG